jgi:hypothetical protein
MKTGPWKLHNPPRPSEDEDVMPVARFALVQIALRMSGVSHSECLHPNEADGWWWGRDLEVQDGEIVAYREVFDAE